MNNSIINTDRLILRHWKETDAEDLYKYASDPEVGPHAGWPVHKSLNESRNVINTIFSNNTTWAIELKETNEVIGCIGYYIHGVSNIDIGENDAEIGYWIGKPYWNKGLCTEALKAIILYCKDKFDTLWADFFVNNPASGRVMEKCGFIDTGKYNYCSHLKHGNDTPIHIMKLNLEKTIDTKNICSLLKKKLFDNNGEYHIVWQEIQNDDSLTAITRSRQLHVYRNGKKILILSGKTQPKIIRDDIINLQYTSKMI